MKVIKLNNFNINIALKIFTLLGFSFFFIKCICTGSVNKYVHPRIIPYMLFAAGTMFVIAFLLSWELFKPQKEKTNSLALLFYIVPLIMAFALPAQSLDTNTRAVGEVQLSGSQSVNVDKGKQNDAVEKDAAINTNKAEVTEKQASSNMLSLQNGILVMDSSNFYNCLNEVYSNLDKYVGIQIEVVGFVFKDNEDLKDNEFVPARLLMVCCAADMQPVGFLCRYDKALELKANSWVKVTGIIGKTEFEEEDVPFIEAKSVSDIDKPDDDYIYPY